MNSETLDLQSMLNRLGRLERQNRRLKLSAFIFLVGFSTFFLMGQVRAPKMPEAIEARKFVVRDLSGNGVAALGLGPQGSPLLVMLRKDGKVGATLEVSVEGVPALTLYDKDKPREIVALDLDGSPGLALSDRNGSARVGLGVANEGSGGLVLYGENKLPRASLGLATNWSPFLLLLDEKGNARTVIGSTAAWPPSMAQIKPQADFSMVMLDSKGAAVWRAGNKNKWTQFFGL
jgi:hypothetical protein